MRKNSHSGNSADCFVDGKCTPPLKSKETLKKRRDSGTLIMEKVNMLENIKMKSFENDSRISSKPRTYSPGDPGLGFRRIHSRRAMYPLVLGAPFLWTLTRRVWASLHPVEMQLPGRSRRVHQAPPDYTRRTFSLCFFFSRNFKSLSTVTQPIM